jgi:hypothetical protein
MTAVPKEAAQKAENRQAANDSIILTSAEEEWKLRIHQRLLQVMDLIGTVEEDDVGIPMYDHARHSAVSRALVTLQSRLLGHATMAERKAPSGGISSLLQKSPLHQLFGDK